VGLEQQMKGTLVVPLLVRALIVHLPVAVERQPLALLEATTQGRVLLVMVVRVYQARLQVQVQVEAAAVEARVQAPLVMVRARTVAVTAISLVQAVQALEILAAVAAVVVFLVQQVLLAAMVVLVWLLSGTKSRRQYGALRTSKRRHRSTGHCGCG
jgi:hypothetical protein